MFCAESAGTIHLIDSLISFLYFEGRGTNIFFFGAEPGSTIHLLDSAIRFLYFEGRKNVRILTLSR